MAIQIRRGTDAQWEAGKSNIVVGEPAITTDTERAFIGTGSGTYVELATIGDTDVTITDIKDNAFIHRTASGAIASFSDGSDMDVDELIVDIEPIQSGSGDPSPTNVRPISGWDSVDVNVVGKNLLDSSNAVPNLPRNVVGAGIDEVVVTTRYAHSIPYKNDVALMVSARSDDLTKFNYIVVYGYNNDKFVSSYGGRNIANTTTVYTIPIPANQYEKIIVVYGADSTTQVGTDISGDIQLELGSTATTYEAYNGNTTTVDLGQTVYGGTLNVTTGVLTIDRAMVDLGTLTWNHHATYTQMWSASVSLADFPTGAFNNQGLCSCYTVQTAGSLAPILANEGIYISPLSWSSGKMVVINDSSLESLSASEVQAKLSGQKLLYYMTTPTTVTLTPTQVNSLLGQNNVWADSGDVEVTYKANASLTIEEIINAITALGGNV